MFYIFLYGSFPVPSGTRTSVAVNIDPVRMSSPQALELVDEATRKLLDGAEDSDQIKSILAGPNVRWQSQARCLRHQKDCFLKMGVDIDTRHSR